MKHPGEPEAPEDTLTELKTRGSPQDMESMEQWEKAEQKLMFQIWKRREQSFRKVEREQEGRSGKNVRFRSAACTVQFLQNQAAMKELIVEPREDGVANIGGSRDKKQGGKSAYKRKLDISPLNMTSKPASETWEDKKIKEIIAKQADVNEQVYIANILMNKTKSVYV